VEIRAKMKGPHNFTKSPESENSKTLGAVGELKRRGESPLTNEKMFRDVAERLPVGVFVAKDRKFIYVNEKLARMHGYTVNEIVGKKGMKDLVHPEDLPRLKKRLMNMLSGKPTSGLITFRGITKTGQIVDLERHDFHFTNSEGRPVIIGTALDVTERKRTEEELKRSWENLQELVEERTRQLAEVNEELRRDIEKRKQVETALEIKSRDLEDANVVLKVLLKQREDDRREFEEKISSNVKELVLRYVGMLRETGLKPDQGLLTEIIERNLNDFLSPFCMKITSFDFTPREMEVILLTKEGKTTKEIAHLLNVTMDAISRHKYHIRKKLGLDRRHNLRSHLLSLS
jgi:PAS domain S-box-containing protein